MTDTPKSIRYWKPEEIIVTGRQWAIMLQDVNNRLPNEACGLIAGSRNEHAVSVKADEIIPITNILNSPISYKMDPNEQIKTILRIEERNLELIAIYHSHPLGPSGPSRTDVMESYYPESVYLIWSYISPEWSCNAFLIQDGSIKNVQLKVI